MCLIYIAFPILHIIINITYFYRREEEAYQLQMEVLRIEEEEQAYKNRMQALKVEEQHDNLSVPSSPLSCRSNVESLISYQSLKEKKTFNNNKNISVFNKREKSSNSGGARPKINNVIDRFGGWGLSEKKSKVYSDEVSRPKNLIDLVDNILEDNKSSLDDDKSKKSKPVSDNVFEKNTVKMSQSLDSNNILNPWSTPEADLKTNEDIKTSAILSSINNNEILYDEKGTFTDLSHENDESTETYEYAASCDSTGTRSEKLKCAEVNSDEIPAQVNVKNEALNHTIDLASKKSIIDSKVDKEEHDEFTSNSYNLFENTFKCVANDSVTNNSFQSTEDSYKTPSTPSGDPWVDNSLKAAANVEPFSKKVSYESSELNHESESHQFNNIIGEGIHRLGKIGSHTDIESSNALFSQLNIAHSETHGNDETSANNVESHILPPHPPHTVPQFAAANNPVFLSNPMFPGSMNFSPMYGYVMDPVMMQQMLLLTNPYFASQLLAMEQYYRSMGMHANVFSHQSQVNPNPTAATPPPSPAFTTSDTATEAFGTYSKQSVEPDVANATPMYMNNCSPDFEHTPLNTQTVSENGKSFKNLVKPPGIDISIAQPDMLSTVRNDDNDCWFKSYLCTDDALPIPPPKPATLNVDESNNSAPNPTSFMLNQNSSTFDSIKSSGNNIDISHKSVSTKQENKVKYSKPLTAMEACVTKTVVRGWSDSADESTESSKPKSTYSWDDDYGQGDNIPAKAIKNSVYDDRKKTTYRQPASQPQVSRFQRNRMYE